MIDFMFELGQLKRVHRSGWWLLGIDNPESVAEHSFRAGAIAYILAKMEGADPYKCMLAALFNDIHESRVNDMHKLGQAYVDFRSGEKKALDAQMDSMPEDIRSDLQKALAELHSQSSKEGVVARDADLLECALQAREYEIQGYKDARDWIVNTSKIMATESGKKLLAELGSADPNNWWKGKKRIER